VQLIDLDGGGKQPAAMIQMLTPVSRDELIEEVTGQTMNALRYRATHGTGSPTGKQVRRRDMINDGETMSIEVSNTDYRVVQMEVYESDDLTKEPARKRRKCGKIYLRASENLHDLAALAGTKGTGPNDPGGMYIATSLDRLEQITFEDMTETASVLEAPTEDGG
jgi:hypothetical protein